MMVGGRDGRASTEQKEFLKGEVSKQKGRHTVMLSKVIRRTIS